MSFNQATSTRAWRVMKITELTGWEKEMSNTNAFITSDNEDDSDARYHITVWDANDPHSEALRICEMHNQSLEA